jgi:hypothetical protein
MARTKKFAGGTKLSDFEPLDFELNGVKFDCKPAIQGSVLLEFVRDADGDSGGDSAKALYSFLSSAMAEEEYNRLQTVLHDPDIIIDIELIGEIVAWLVEEYSARPTTQPEVSSTGQTISGTTSTEELSSPGAV